MTKSLWRAYLDAVGRLDYPTEREATPPVPTVRNGRAILVGFICGVEHEASSERLVQSQAAIVYDVETGLTEAQDFYRELDEPVEAKLHSNFLVSHDIYLSAQQAYAEILEDVGPEFMQTGILPAARYFGRLSSRLIGPGLWELYRELAPDFTALVEPFRTRLPSVTNEATMTTSPWRAYLDAVGELDFPDVRQVTLPVPSVREGRAALIGLICRADYTDDPAGRLVGTESEVVYDLNTGVAEANPIDRRLDEPARGLPPGEHRSIVEAYRELLDLELPIFKATHSLPSPQRFGELTSPIGPGVWQIYCELAPDFTSVVGPFRTGEDR